jgi:hypothetical protein
VSHFYIIGKVERRPSGPLPGKFSKVPTTDKQRKQPNKPKGPKQTLCTLCELCVRYLLRLVPLHQFQRPVNDLLPPLLEGIPRPRQEWKTYPTGFTGWTGCVFPFLPLRKRVRKINPASPEVRRVGHRPTQTFVRRTSPAKNVMALGQNKTCERDPDTCPRSGFIVSRDASLTSAEGPT